MKRQSGETRGDAGVDRSTGPCGYLTWRLQVSETISASVHRSEPSIPHPELSADLLEVVVVHLRSAQRFPPLRESRDCREASRRDEHLGVRAPQ